MAVKLNYTNGIDVEHATLTGAMNAVLDDHPDAVFFDAHGDELFSGSIADDYEWDSEAPRILVWMSEEDSESDDGGLAVAEITLAPRDYAGEVAAWDKQDITVLRDIVAQVGDNPEELGIDMADLPSAIPVPDQIADYPVWAIDAMGQALVGAAADEVENLSEILAGYAASVHDYHYRGYDSVEKLVGPGNATSSRVNLPADWRGKRVRIIRIDP